MSYGETWNMIIFITLKIKFNTFNHQFLFSSKYKQWAGQSNMVNQGFATHTVFWAGFINTEQWVMVKHDTFYYFLGPGVNPIDFKWDFILWRTALLKIMLVLQRKVFVHFICEHKSSIWILNFMLSQVNWSSRSGFCIN